MPNTCNANGSFAKLIVEGGAATRTFDANSERYAILAETLSRQQPFQGRRRIVGDLSQYNGAIRPHSYMVSGAIVLQCSPKDLHAWMPRVLWNAPGTSGGANTYTVGVDADDYEFDVLIDRENGVFRYNNCRVAQLEIRSVTESGQQPENEELLEMIIYIMGMTETIDGTTWPVSEPAITLDGAFSPYAHWEGAFTLNSNVTRYSQFSLKINNRLIPSFYNSLTPVCFRSAGRVITMDMQVPFTATTIDDAEALISASAAGSLVFTHGVPGLSATFAFPALRNNYQAPVVRSKQEIPLNLSLEAFRTSGATELTITNDHTPT